MALSIAIKGFVESRALILVPALLVVFGGFATNQHKADCLGGPNAAQDLTLVQGRKIVHQAEPLPFGRIVSNKPGYLESPYAPYLLIDVRGLETGTVVVDPLCRKGFVVPEMIYLAPVYAPPDRDGKMIIDRGLRK